MSSINSSPILRTDSRYLTTDIEDTMLERLQALQSAYKEEIQPALKQRGKVNGEARFQ